MPLSHSFGTVYFIALPNEISSYGFFLSLRL
ncbi:hypothetical protein GJM98_04860 [Vibrio parahaemolyticus]|nr:hypothetical protein [Vibrio parahaemolyticus]EGR3004027.1 hypothetical protein [Vibrio parahaemolyticus]EGR3008386.1 hypothetical protein [Vibrio parahaemolyticus]EGR3141509.1 hypothetical protein [Vibrio parahaemolyticus]EGR3180941.1 hypothetical protein [Vibrio parahaemolyticus]